MASRYDLTVASNHYLTPHMRRIVLKGDDLKNFPLGQESGYVKVLVTDTATSKTLKRSYTVRHFDHQRLELTLDFVDHGDNGPASAWANHCVPGDAISVTGPGATKLVDPNADWYMLAADMSSLPALSVNLEKLRPDAQGVAFIEVLAEEDRQQIKHPAGLDVRWLINRDGASGNQCLSDAVTSWSWDLPGTPYPWFAGEFDTMRLFRTCFRSEHKVDKRAMYLSSYWKFGDTDEGMKRAKMLDKLPLPEALKRPATSP